MPPGKKGQQAGGGGGHDAGGMMRWLLTYADMITLLVAFFIMMYSMSVVSLAKFEKLAVSVRGGFGGQTTGMGDTIIKKGYRTPPVPGVTEEGEMAVLGKIRHKITDYAQRKGLGSSIRAYVDERGLTVSFGSEQVLFDIGQATLKPKAKVVLHGIMKMLRDLSNPIRVEGHTCDLPISTPQFPSNWELSTTRATNVVRYLIAAEGVTPTRLSAAGYGDSRPRVPNSSESNRALNRRVDLVVIATSEQRKEPEIQIMPTREDLEPEGGTANAGGTGGTSPG